MEAGVKLGEGKEEGHERFPSASRCDHRFSPLPPPPQPLPSPYLSSVCCTSRSCHGWPSLDEHPTKPLPLHSINPVPPPYPASR